VDKDIERDCNTVLEFLSDTLDRDYEASFSPDELKEETQLSGLRLQKALDALLTYGWIEKARESLAGFEVRMTFVGKQRYDSQNDKEDHNEALRQKILAVLATAYEKNPHTITGSDTLETELNASCNQICVNLQIMALSGLVELTHLSCGKPYFNATLTHTGKSLFDNPPELVLFLSHAAIDRRIAARLRTAIQDCFPKVSVFVSSAPDVLEKGDPWVEKILGALQTAKAALILTTERGLSRHWVWFESGAAWSKKVPMLPVCLGRQRKDRLPPPFTLYTGSNLDDPEDIEGLLKRLEGVFGKSVSPVDPQRLAEEFKSLNSEVELALEPPTVAAHA
jgi:hypothetical protein